MATKKKKAMKKLARKARERAEKAAAEQATKKAAAEQAAAKKAAEVKTNAVALLKAESKLAELKRDFTLEFSDVEITLAEIEDGDEINLDEAITEMNEGTASMRKIRTQVSEIVRANQLDTCRIMTLASIQELEARVKKTADTWQARQAKLAADVEAEIRRKQRELKAESERKLDAVVDALNIRGQVTVEAVRLRLQKRFFELVPAGCVTGRLQKNCEKAERLLDLVERVFPNLEKVKELRPLIYQAVVRDPRKPTGFGLRTVRAA